MNWAVRRRFLYVLITFLAAGTLFAIVFRNVLYQAPTCFDSKQNGEEVGIDCGGGCARYCPNTLALPKVRWKRSFPIASGFAHAVASIEHNYPNTGLRSLTYEFTLLDANNERITTRRGTTFIGGHGRSAIIEPLIPVGKQVPVVTQFEILSSDSWEKFPAGVDDSTFKVERTDLETLVDATRLTATLTNQSASVLRNVQVIAILYDTKDNAITASKTELQSVASLGRVTAYFTWDFALPRDVARIEIIPRVNPFTDVIPQ
ncbi:MAG TPA: hypothetical protein VLB02_01260 [Candidatus Paceibacterota bacterium]|nr:hypothetical protein [Candidatus Paceibacterota bacterium]